MEGEKICLMGLFRDEGQAVSAVRGLKDSGEFHLERVHSPIASHDLDDALGLPKSKVGWFTLAGGIIGFFSGFLLAVFTATRWNMIVSGKPVVALAPFFIVGFEFTILFAVFGNVIGLITQARLPRFKIYTEYDPRLTGDRYGVLASCDAPRRNALSLFFETKGAKVKPFKRAST
ncbi:MAG: DUF3341 domain-containing protein [Desulfobacteraceae bacterium]|nr:DUF3341 domain-containing protein [Desulfobacteraceae bacterium]